MVNVVGPLYESPWFKLYLRVPAAAGDPWALDGNLVGVPRGPRPLVLLKAPKLRESGRGQEEKNRDGAPREGCH